MIKAADIRTKADEFYACMVWASRRNPANPRGFSQKQAARLLREPEVLDYLETTIRQRREREGLPT